MHLMFSKLLRYKLFLLPLFILLFLPFVIHHKQKPKVYDCFLFFNEFELLEIRLAELYDHVDKFVLVESVETFQGNSKPLYFAENRHLFKKFEDKIVYVCLEERTETENPWDREYFQRNQITRGLKECRDDDIILLSDLDEIVRPSSLPQIISNLKRAKRKYVCTEQKMYAFYLNRFRSMWQGTVATTYGMVKTKTPQYFRDRRNKKPFIPNAGWHFSYLGGVERVIEKIEAFAHSEANTSEKKDRDRLIAEMESGHFEKLDDSYPKYVQENAEHFYKIGFLH